MSVEFIYFDLGNVLCPFDRDKEVRQVAEVSGASEEKVREVLLGSSGILWEFEKGKLDDQGFYEAFCKATETRPEPAALRRANDDIFTLNGSLVPLLAHLEDAQIALGVLSNTSPAHWRHLTDGKFAVLPGAFGTFALSYEVGAIKPNEKIFRRAIELAHRPADRIFYVDDIAEHVEAARKQGMDAVQYSTTDALARELLKRGVRCNY